jgi:hypothetical protein
VACADAVIELASLLCCRANVADISFVDAEIMRRGRSWRWRGTAGEPPQSGAHVAPDTGLTHLICINAPIALWHQSKKGNASLTGSLAGSADG